VELTKWSHSCVTLTKDSGTLVVDPGMFSELDRALPGASAVLVTHEHPDHLDADKVRAALEADDQLQLFAPASVAAGFAQFGERVTAVDGGESFEVAGFTVRTFGIQHAVIHPRIPVIANVGFLVDDDVFHPGDSYTVPEVPVRLLLHPATAPWARVWDAVDHAVAVRAPRSVPIHEAVYSDAGRGMVYGMVSGVLEGFGCEYTPLSPGTSVEV
jgi:L-ascorbate metabolism protein UlaG (beta-lactamase superfamily)